MELKDFIIYRILTLRKAKKETDSKKLLYVINSKLDELESIALQFNFLREVEE